MVVPVSDREPLARLEHDLRAPLCAIRAMVEALQDGMVKEPATLAQNYARIGRQIAQLSSLVDDLFTLVRLGSAAPRPEMRPAQLGAAGDLARRKRGHHRREGKAVTDMRSGGCRWTGST